MKHFVILAGGSGQRLWPLSTEKWPKHLIPFFDNKSMLEQTIDRISDNIKDRKIWILTNQSQLNLVKNHVKSLNVDVIAEPIARNTAPAILWICHQINNIDSNATIIILPADHFIPEKEKFGQTIDQAVNFAINNAKIITLGIVPTSPATGYGYIQVNISKPMAVYPVLKFHEKPTLEKAQSYVTQKNFFWNSGIFIGKASTFLNEFRTTSPKLFEDMQTFICNKIGYANIENISIDFAIMEKSSNISLIPANFEWHDVGNLSVLLSLKKRFSKTSETVINIDGFNNLTSTSKKVVVCIGLSDLCIIETPDVIMIAKNDCTENVKLVFPKLKNVNTSEGIL